MIKAISCIFISIIASVSLSAAVVLTQYVTDETGVLTPSQIERMVRVATELEQKTGIQVATYVARSLNGAPIEQVAGKVFADSGIGDQKKDQGVLFVVAPKERKVRIEVGYGVEGDIPDGRAGQIIDQQVLVHFRSKDIAGGIESGHMAITAHLAQARGVTLNGVVRPQVKRQKGVSILALLMLLAAVGFMTRGRGGLLPWVILGGLGNHNDRWGGGGFGGGGFGGFGGGMSGGGGASRGW